VTSGLHRASRVLPDLPRALARVRLGARS
jgi:hypothetical protein